jgi:hypothetical protein
MSAAAASASDAFASRASANGGSLGFKELLDFAAEQFAAVLPTRPFENETICIIIASAILARAGKTSSDSVKWDEVSSFFSHPLLTAICTPPAIASTAAVLFERYDRDAGGYIDKTEAASLIRCIFGVGGNQLTPETAATLSKHVFAAVDGNKNSKLERSEVEDLLRQLGGAPAGKV